MEAGLDGVVAATTVLSHVDGLAGQLILRGLTVEEAAATMTFEEITALLWRDLAPGANDPETVTAGIQRARVAAFERIGPLLPCVRHLTAVESLRLMLSALGDHEDLPHHLLIVGATPVFVAAIGRQRQGLAPVPPDPTLSQAADYLRMVHGVEAPPEAVKALDTYLVTVSDHGLNASTFAARVVASTKAGTISAVVGALCALKGPLHGGAPGPVLDMLEAIGTVDNIRPWLMDHLLAGERLMGFGHRIYKVRDPRADVLKNTVGTLKSERIAFAELVEREAIAVLEEHKPGRQLQTNVEYYTALLLDGIGLPRELFTPTFAIGRTAGWTGHILEQERFGRILRPQSHYVGPHLPKAA